MAGSVAGGKLAAETNKKKYGENYYANLGKIGGSTPTTRPKGFAAMDKDKVRAAGRLGGTRSKRKKTQ